jgi:hypothetical protein
LKKELSPASTEFGGGIPNALLLYLRREICS